MSVRSEVDANYERWLEGLAPHAPASQYRYNDTGGGNAHAHLNARSWAARWWSR